MWSSSPHHSWMTTTPAPASVSGNERYAGVETDGDRNAIMVPRMGDALRVSDRPPRPHVTPPQRAHPIERPTGGARRSLDWRDATEREAYRARRALRDRSVVLLRIDLGAHDDRAPRRRLARDGDVLALRARNGRARADRRAHRANQQCTAALLAATADHRRARADGG